jgi:hypothetical protein
MKKSIELRIESVRRLIYQHETKMNPHYDINPEIKLPIQSIGSEGRHHIKYEVEYISRLNPKWRKWYNKEIDIDIDKAIAEYRDVRLEEILKGSDS